MDLGNKATRISLLDFKSPPMRAFHMTWFAFFLCFFAWFGIAPLMPTIRREMNLTPEQVGNLIIASVAVTVLARLFIGWLCDRIGPRITYTWLLLLGSIPVMSIGFAQSYESLFWFRLAIGAIGASFVITQYHTSVMFAPNCVGTANATTAGWGNAGGGFTQEVMPLLTAGLLYLGVGSFWSWRVAMFLAGAVCFLTGIAYYALTQDCPAGNYRELRKAGRFPTARRNKVGFLTVCRDSRVWILFLLYGACFGIELTIDNMAATYFFDNFDLSETTAGLVAGLFGMMCVFARTLGGLFGDLFGGRWGLKGRVAWLFITVFAEGITLIWFSQMGTLPTAIVSMLLFGLFVQMATGATYSVVPFINKGGLGIVSGIVGAGGNVGAVAAGFLFKTPTAWWPTALFILGVAATLLAFASFGIRFSEQTEEEERTAFEQASSLREATLLTAG